MPDSKEYCSKCKDWRLYDNDGHCWICGKQLLGRESTEEMLAYLTAKGYIQ